MFWNHRAVIQATASSPMPRGKSKIVLISRIFSGKKKQVPSYLSLKMERTLQLANGSSSPGFVLLGFPAPRGARDFLFAVFLCLYLLTLLENTLIICLVCSHSELRQPMYFFLGHLGGLEACYVSVTVPTLLAGLWTGPFRISSGACMTQLFCFGSLLGTKCSLLATMAYDRYVAICRPLRYPLLLRPGVCRGLALSSWLGGLLVSVIKTACIASLSYCGPRVLNHFFCDVSPLLDLSCTHVALTELVDFVSAIVILWGSLLVALASYVAIGRAVLRMRSAAARRKALSTCASHLVVLGCFYSAVLFPCPRPGLHKALAVVYTAATPACSPVVYCLRNRAVHAALRRALHPGTVATHLPPPAAPGKLKGGARL